ncbi:MAG: hypothetical protein AAGF11_07520 [Myxococcota bacterium]
MALLSLPLVLALGPADAVTLEWDGPPDCADTSEVRARVHEMLGANASSALAAEAVVRPLGSGYRLSLVVHRDQERITREVEAKTCEEIIGAAALIMAVAVNTEPMPRPPPSTAPALDPPEPKPTPAPEPAKSVSPPPEPAKGSSPSSTPRPPMASVDRASTRARPSSRWSLAPELSLGTQVTTPLTLGVGAVVGWRHGAWGIELGATHWLARTLSIDRSAEIGLALTHGTLRGCRRPAVGRVELPLCAGIGLGGFQARPQRGLEQPRPTAEVWSAITASAGVSVMLSPRWALTARLEALFPLVRPALSVDTNSVQVPIYRIPPLAGLASIGVEFRVP